MFFSKKKQPTYFDEIKQAMGEEPVKKEEKKGMFDNILHHRPKEERPTKTEISAEIRQRGIERPVERFGERPVERPVERSIEDLRPLDTMEEFPLSGHVSHATPAEKIVQRNEWDREPAMEMPFEEPPAREYRRPASVDSAQLFVKVDKYKEVFTTLQEMKLFVSSVKQLFFLMQELEAVRNDALTTMRSSVQRIERSMTQIDNDLLRPRDVRNTDMNVPEAETRHMEETLSSLQKQLADLKSELQTMRA